MRINELSKKSKIPIHTIRRIADSGGIPFTLSAGGHRVFDQQSLNALIRLVRLPRAVALINTSEIPHWVKAKGKRIDVAKEIGSTATHTRFAVNAYCDWISDHRVTLAIIGFSEDRLSLGNVGDVAMHCISRGIPTVIVNK